MLLSSISTLLSATPFASSLLPLALELVPLIAKVGVRIVAFRTQPINAAATLAFETDVQRQLQHMGRVLLAWVYNRLEPDDPGQAPAQVEFEHNLYRRRERSPRRWGVATLFGIIALWRLRYEPCDEGVGLVCLFPLEERLGLLLGKATPALAQRLGPWAAQHTQQNVLNLLQQEHHVSWSVETLRTMTAALSAAVTPLRHRAQVAQLLKLLRQAHDAPGPHRPVLCVGRDGVFVPIRNDTNYREGSTATVAVLDRHGRKLGTMFLGQMPEPGQETLSQELTALVRDVLNEWHGPLPRLQYVTDGGHHPTDYCERVVLNMLHPRTGAKLPWEWILDYYHACQYITKMAEALFGKTTKKAATWAAKMRRWLKNKNNGAFRVLHSAAALAARLEFTEAEHQDYHTAYNYLSNRMQLMDYAAYRRRGLAIGSGITEAACKTVFTQRFKQSGMKWSLEGGQVIVDLRVIYLSGLWTTVYDAYVTSLSQDPSGTNLALNENSYEIAA
jgi:hypothetical protein